MVNPKEIEFYGKKNLYYETELKPFSRMPDITSERLFDDLVNFNIILRGIKAKKVLEGACGGGWLSKMLCRFGYEVSAFDQSPDLIEKNREYAGKNSLQIEYFTADFEDFKVDGLFDVGIIYDALHHTKEPFKVVKCFFDALVQGGKLIIAEPSLLHRISGSARELTRETGIIEEGFSRSSLKRILRKAGFGKVRFFVRNTTVHYSGRPLSKQWFRNFLKLFFYCPGEKIWAVAEK
mgnify:CR=1 FL=1